MPMTYKNKQYQEIAITLLNKSVKKNLFIFIGLFYLSGEPISLHLLLCDPFAVDHRYGPRLASAATSCGLGWAGVGTVRE
jgi:hypothetical protein